MKWSFLVSISPLTAQCLQTHLWEAGCPPPELWSPLQDHIPPQLWGSTSCPHAAPPPCQGGLHHDLPARRHHHHHRPKSKRRKEVGRGMHFSCSMTHTLHELRAMTSHAWQLLILSSVLPSVGQVPLLHDPSQREDCKPWVWMALLIQMDPFLNAGHWSQMDQAWRHFSGYCPMPHILGIP